MPVTSSRPVTSLTAWIRTKRHALLGTACALGLVLLPLTGGAVVVGITAARHPAVVALQTPAQPATVPVASSPEAVVSLASPTQLSTSPAAPSSEPVRVVRRGRGGRE